MSNRFEGNIYIVDSGSNPINSSKPLKVVSILFNGTGTTSVFQIKQGTGVVFINMGNDSSSVTNIREINFGGPVWFSSLSSGTVTDGTGFLITV